MKAKIRTRAVSHGFHKKTFNFLKSTKRKKLLEKDEELETRQNKKGKIWSSTREHGTLIADLSKDQLN